MKIRSKFVPFNNSLNKETISTFLVLKAEFRCGITMGGEILRFSGWFFSEILEEEHSFMNQLQTQPNRISNLIYSKAYLWEFVLKLFKFLTERYIVGFITFLRWRTWMLLKINGGWVNSLTFYPRFFKTVW